MKKWIKKQKIYALIQSYYTKFKYSCLIAKYNKASYSSELKFPKISVGEKVLYIGTDELQDKSGFIQELEKLCKLTTFTRFDGRYGQYPEKFFSKDSGRVLNTKRLDCLLQELEHKGETPDVIIAQTWARLWDIDKLIKLKNKYQFKFINICMDDRHSFYMLSPFMKYNRGTSGLADVIDASLVTSKECISWYHSRNIPSKYFPEATSSLFFNKLNVEKKYDVGFVGANYGLRGAYIQYLIDNGVKVEAYGTGWDNGRIDNSKVNLFMNQCRIVIGFGYILGCEDFMALKLRDFDVPACGTFYLTTDNSDLYDLFPEKEGCYFHNKESLLEKVNYYLVNDKEREDIARKSYNNAIDNHTYASRLLEVFK